MMSMPVEECRDVEEEDGGRESYLYPARPIDELAVAHGRVSRHFFFTLLKIAQFYNTSPRRRTKQEKKIRIRGNSNKTHGSSGTAILSSTVVFLSPPSVLHPLHPLMTYIKEV